MMMIVDKLTLIHKQSNNLKLAIDITDKLSHKCFNDIIVTHTHTQIKC